MNTIPINPLWIEIGGPALAAGLVLGGLIAWLVFRSRQRRLQETVASLSDRIKDQDALQAERDAAFDAATSRLATAFSDLSNKSLKANSENFLRLAEQNLATQHERAKRELGDREQAVENLVKPIKDALHKSQAQIDALEKSRSEAYGGIKSQLETMQIHQQSLAQETQNLVKALRRPEVRGRWGEITLRRLVELAGMVEHCDFHEQVHTTGDEKSIRPDMIVRMPDTAGRIPRSSRGQGRYATKTGSGKTCTQRSRPCSKTRVENLLGTVFEESRIRHPVYSRRPVSQRCTE
jgi:DNA recombination protein RmuC